MLSSNFAVAIYNTFISHALLEAILLVFSLNKGTLTYVASLSNIDRG